MFQNNNKKLNDKEFLFEYKMTASITSDGTYSTYFPAHMLLLIYTGTYCM